MLQVCVHIKHVVVLVALLLGHQFSRSQCSHILTFFLPLREFFVDFVDSHAAKTGLLRCCLYSDYGDVVLPLCDSELDVVTNAWGVDKRL